MESGLKNEKKCFFLDRDGTINVYKGLISDIESIELEKNAGKAVKLINDSGYLAILITNQPVVAMGLCTEEKVREFHKKIASLLGADGAFLDEYVFCPHYPEKKITSRNLNECDSN